MGPGLVNVLDFGLAKVLQDKGEYVYGTPTGFAMGTRGFMSGEPPLFTHSVAWPRLRAAVADRNRYPVP